MDVAVDIVRNPGLVYICRLETDGTARTSFGSKLSESNRAGRYDANLELAR